MSCRPLRCGWVDPTHHRGEKGKIMRAIVVRTREGCSSSHKTGLRDLLEFALWTSKSQQNLTTTRARWFGGFRTSYDQNAAVIVNAKLDPVS
eukprot:5732701-Amphidinium_carterae.1